MRQRRGAVGRRRPEDSQPVRLVGADDRRVAPEAVPEADLDPLSALQEFPRRDEQAGRGDEEARALDSLGRRRVRRDDDARQVEPRHRLRARLHGDRDDRRRGALLDLLRALLDRAGLVARAVLREGRDGEGRAEERGGRGRERGAHHFGEPSSSSRRQAARTGCVAARPRPL
jgi:hypothetical protein